MIAAILEGVLMGLLLSVFIGPVFFLLIDTSINKGVSKAFIMDAGVLFSDMLWIFLLYWGIDNYLGEFLQGNISMIAAGFVFVVFGLTGVFKHNNKTVKTIEKRNSRLFVDGFMLNSINPSVALFWLATVSFAIHQFNQSKVLIGIYFTCIFVTIVIVDFFKFYMASKLSNYLNEKRQSQMSLATSLILIGFGVFMIFTRGTNL